MVEIEQRRGFANLFQHAGVLATARCVEFNQVAWLVVLFKRGVFTQRGQRHALQQLRIARAECMLGRQAERRALALAHTEQRLLQRRCQLPLAEQQRRGLVTKGGNDVRIVLQGDAVVQRQIGIRPNYLACAACRRLIRQILHAQPA